MKRFKMKKDPEMMKTMKYKYAAMLFSLTGCWSTYKPEIVTQ